MFLILKYTLLTKSHSENNGRGRYPYVDNRQGKFLGRSYLRAVDIITRNEPDEQFFDRIELLSAINKIKHTVKKKQHDLKAMLLVYEILDEVTTVTAQYIIMT